MPQPLVASHVLTLLTLAGTIYGGAAAGAAQPADTAPAAKQADQAKPETLLKDFVHYVRIDRADLAVAMGQSLLDRGLDPQSFVRLVESTEGVSRFQTAISQAQRNGQIEPIASKLLSLFNEGKLASVRSPDQVAENIKLLTGNQVQRSYGRDRLKAACEYAMPQLLQSLLQRTDARLAGEVRQLMIEMGRCAVMPLSTALPELDPVAQQEVCEILGAIQYPAAVPFLHQVRADSSVPEVQRSAEDAIRQIVGVVNESVSTSTRFTDLAENYYAQSPSLTLFPGDPYQLFWTFDPGAGLLMQAVDTAVWHEAMAMRLTETALREDASNAQAIPLWIASNFSREIDSPEGYVNPVYGSDRREAMYYAVAAGPAPVQQVLARGMDASDTPLARRALAALEQTAGGQSLWSGQGDRRPLLEALRYPNKRVQYEAAIALGAASPEQAFEGSDQVVRILASAIRDVAAKYALVVSSDAERGKTIADALRAEGYTLLPTSRSLDEVAQPIAESAGIDLIVTDLPSASTAETITQAHSMAKLRATPVLAVVTGQAYAEQADRFARDARVRMVRQGASSSDLMEAGRQLLDIAIGGPVTAEEAEAYRTRCLAVLRDLAVSENPVLKIEDAAGPLVAFLPEATGEMKMKVAEVLSYVGLPVAQSALMDASTVQGISADDQIAMLAKVTASARRFGNLLEPRHISTIKQLATQSRGPEATAAAALMGALNLPNADMVPLIVGAGEAMPAAAK